MRTVGVRDLLFIAATTVGTLVFLSEVVSAYGATAYFLGIAGAVALAGLNGATDGRAITSVALASVVGLGYIAAMKWYNIHNYRLPPIPESQFLEVPLAAIVLVCSATRSAVSSVKERHSRWIWIERTVHSGGARGSDG